MIPAWVWWGGGLAGGLAIFWFTRSILGWKWAAIAGAAFVALGSLKGGLTRAEMRGRDEQERRQLEQNLRDIQRALAARERERQRLQENPNALRDDDGFRRPD